MTVVSTRLATPADAEQAVAVLRASITRLCERDHQGDPATLERWLRNKTAEQFNTWVADPDGRVMVAEVDSVIAGVVALHRSGEIRLCYVRPEIARSGVGRAMLVAVERHASHWGIRTLALDSTLTARAFYERCGYVSAGEAKPAFGILRCYPYLKALSTGGSTSRIA